MEPTLFKYLGGRKFTLAMIVLAVGAATHIVSERGINTEFVALLLGVVGTFNVANTMITNKTASMTSDSEEEGKYAPIPPMTVTADPALTESIQQMSQDMMVVSTTLETLSKAVETNSNVSKAVLQTLTTKRPA